MAKGKSSRKERRAQRQKSERAREHGLPSRPPERPQPRARGTRDSEGRRLRPDDDAALPSEAPLSEGGAAEPSRLRRYLARVLDLPTAGKLAILAILGVIVLAIVSGLRDRGGSGREVAPPPATLPSPSAPLGLPELPASPGDASVLPVPSAEPSAQPPAASAKPPGRAVKPPTKASPSPAPQRGDNPY